MKSVFTASLLSFLSAVSLLPMAAGVAGCQSSKEKDESVSGRLEFSKQFLASGDYRRAVQTLQAFVKENPRNAEAHNLLGLSYLGLGNAQAAANSFQTVVAIDKSNYDAGLNWSYALILVGKHENARKVLNDILDDGTYPYMERVHANMGLSYMEQNQCKLARIEFDKALLLDPTFVTAHFNSGKCSLKSKDFATAVASFRKAVDFCPGCLDPMLELARARYLVGEKKEARDSLQTLLRSRIDTASAERTRKLLQEMKR